MGKPSGWQGVGDVTKQSSSPSVPSTNRSTSPSGVGWEGLCDSEMTKPHASPSVPGQK